MAFILVTHRPDLLGCSREASTLRDLLTVGNETVGGRRPATTASDDAELAVLPRHTTVQCSICTRHTSSHIIHRRQESMDGDAIR